MELTLTDTTDTYISLCILRLQHKFAIQNAFHVFFTFLNALKRVDNNPVIN